MVLRKTSPLAVAVLAAAAALVLSYFLIYTSPGSRFLATRAISGAVAPDEMTYDDYEGDLGHGMTFQNLEIKNLKNLPEGSALKVQRLYFNLTAFGLSGVTVEIDNARLKLPDSDPVIIAGSFKGGELDFNIYSNGFTVTEARSYLPDLKLFVPILGEAGRIDLYVTGHYLEPLVKGQVVVERFLYKGFLLSGAPLDIDVQLKDLGDDLKIFGTVGVSQGSLETKRVVVNLNQGGLRFEGPWDQPRINLNGSARVEKTNIQIALKGTAADPELSLTSEPPLPKQKLMVMLATGKSWQSVEGAGENGFNSAELVKDFVDYFFFAGKSSEFADRFGLTELSVTFDQNGKGVAAKKELSDNLDVGYGIEQKTANGQATTVSQKLESDLKLTDEVTVGVEREMKKTSANGMFEESVNEKNDKVMLKYQKSF